MTTSHDWPRPGVCFIDEAGDPVIFGRRGARLVDSPGCSRYFILGSLNAANAPRLAAELEGLHASLLKEPYFQGVPSMLRERGRTSRSLHAKDDLPEIRREVLRFLTTQPITLDAVAVDKLALLACFPDVRRQTPGFRYRPTQLHSAVIRPLLAQAAVPHGIASITVAKRGKRENFRHFTACLNASLRTLGAHIESAATAPPHLALRPAHEVAELQAADYLLWTIQRSLERGEHRFLNTVRSRIRTMEILPAMTVMMSGEV
jgi:hypothetical protein